MTVLEDMKFIEDYSSNERQVWTSKVRKKRHSYKVFAKEWEFGKHKSIEKQIWIYTQIISEKYKNRPQKFGFVYSWELPTKAGNGSISSYFNFEDPEPDLLCGWTDDDLIYETLKEAIQGCLLFEQEKLDKMYNNSDDGQVL